MIREFRSSRKRAGSSPPSPLFERACRRLKAAAMVWCASAESEPCDIPPLEKRLTISVAGSTSSSGMASAPGRSSRRSRSSIGSLPFTSSAKRSYFDGRSFLTARRSAWAASTTSGFVSCGSPPLRNLT